MTKAFFQNLGILLGSLTLTLLLAEIALRVTYPLYSNYDTEMWRYGKDIKVAVPDPKISHEHRPHMQGNFYGTSIRTNSVGWRDVEYPIGKNKYRVMVLGDSITLGWGVDVEDSFPKILERSLRNKNVDLEVMNTGVGNYNTQMEVSSFLKKGAGFHPDAIVLAYYINDAEVIRPQLNPVAHTFKSTYVYSVVSSKLLSLGIQFNPGLQFEAFYRALYQPEFAGRKAVEDSFQVLAEYTHKNGIDLSVVVIPEMHQFKPYLFPEVTQFVENTGKKHSVSVVDLLPYFENENPQELWVSLEDAHPNARGQAIIARGIEEQIFKGRPSLLRHLASTQEGTDGI